MTIPFEKELNREQLDVVRGGDGPCLVLAGAGSGKTRTVTYRVAYLLETGIKPEEILLVTFTNKAAREMVSRVQTITKSAAPLPWSGTFHHVAYRLLRQYAPLLGYRNNFTVLDSEDSQELVKLCLKREGIERRDRRFPSAAVVRSLISYGRNAEMALNDIIARKHPQWINIADTILAIAGEYAGRKRAANAMDFDDLLVNVRDLLAHSEAVRKKFATQFRYVLVDEYQDTNKVQASIVRLLSSVYRNVLVVGDDAQSIYSFRAASIRNILDFEAQYPGAKVFRLETNYRSTPDILDLANDVISQNADQYEKALRGVRDRFAKPQVRAFADQTEEAGFIADRILELGAEGVPLAHMAVLFRAAFHSQALEIELTRRDIPYDYRGGVRFFERSHIKDVLAYLRIFHNHSDTLAWMRVLNMHAGIGPATAEKIVPLMVGAQDELAVAYLEEVGSGLSARARLGWNDFLCVWRGLASGDHTPSGLITAVKDSKYAEYLELQYPDYRDRLQDIEQLALFAEREPDLTKFLAEASMQESYAAAQARGADKEEEKIVLSTIHQAKGLEWEAVFILNLAAGQFPNERASAEEGGLQEERRLFYVAITRAKKHLYLTYPLTGGVMTYLSGPSIFLSELNRELVDEHHFGSGNVFSDPGDALDDVTYVSEDDEPFPSKKKKREFLKSIDDL